eukprot:766294-Hanusia_phi.AAC.5
MSCSRASSALLLVHTLCLVIQGEFHNPSAVPYTACRQIVRDIQRLRGGCSSSTSSSPDENSEFEQREWGMTDNDREDEIAFELEISYWKSFYEDLTTTTKSLCKLGEKLLDHASAMIQHAIESSQSCMEEFLAFTGEIDVDDSSNLPAETLEAFEHKFKDMRMSLSVNMGIAILALKKFRKADEIFNQLNFLLESKIVGELEEYLQGLDEKKKIKLSRKEFKKREHRKMEMLYIDFYLSRLEVQKAAALARMNRIQLSKSLHQYEKAYQALLSVQDGNLVELLKWCNRNKEELLKHDSSLMLISQAHLQQVQLLCRRGLHEDACEFVRWWYDEMSLESHSFPQLLINDVNIRKYPVSNIDEEDLFAKLKEKPWASIAEGSSYALRSSFWLLLFKPHSEYDMVRSTLLCPQQLNLFPGRLAGCIAISVGPS